MGFPYVNAPFDSWVQDELWRRENTKTDLNQYTPFIWLSSAAVVCKGTKPPSIDDALRAKVYNGCVISDKLSTDLRYPVTDTIIGYDLDGKEIKVIGEKKNTEDGRGLRPPPPIITSMDIDTDGENNTLKEATIQITIFSLKQLEMFELFFLKPSMLVVLEYGHNVSKTSNNVNSSKLNVEISKSSFINVKSYKEYVEKIKEFFNPDSLKYRENRKKYLKILENTAGNYDFWVARVTNFNVTYNSEDNTYAVALTVSGGNELQMWMPLKQQSTSDKEKGGTKEQATAKANDATTWMTKLCSELMIPADTSKTFIDEAIKNYASEFFNYGKNANTNDKDSASKEEYISFKLILDILNNVEIAKSVNKKIDYDLIQFDGKPIIPVNSDKNIVSTNRDFIFPGKIPNLVVSQKNPSQVLFSDKPYDFPINEKSFNVGDNPALKYKNATDKDFELKTSGTIGNLLNVFVRSSLFVKFFRESYTYADFFNSLFDSLNDALFGLTKLEISGVDGEIRAPLTIIDKKILQPKTDVIEEKKFYRFKNGPLNGILHEMSFNLEMSNLMQANALYESQLQLYNDKPDTKKDGEGTSWEEDRKYFRLIGQTNADNLYSVDNASHEINKLTKQFQLKPQNEGDGQETKTENKEVAADPKNLQSALDGKYIKFENPKTKTILPLIYEDYTFILSRINGKPTNASVLTYLECDITIDGISGIKCGEMFKLDGIPEMYNKKGAFQVLNIKQSIQSDTGWRTSINAGFRYNED